MIASKRPSAPKRAGIATRLAGIMNRAAASLSLRFHVHTANLWRDNYNPLRGLTIQRAATLLEEGERGSYAELQWLYRSIEMQDATLGALIERRTSAIQRMDWDIKTRDDVPAGKEKLAEKQAEALREAYEGISNLSAALEFLTLASFRGFAHLEKVYVSGKLKELAPVDQWFWVREGIYGAWMLNRDGKPGARTGEAVPLERFVIREVSRPVNRVALIAFVRKGLSQKDWDAFIETYGIPAVFVIMPPDVPSGKEDEYLETADAVVSDARGALPHGSDIKTVDNGARGNNPFKDHIAYQDEQIILRGTGGKLTMLAESGSGTLAGGAHSDTFEQIAQAEAAEISEILRRAIDAEVIEAVTPGERAWAYFEIAANEETDPADIVTDAVALHGAGYAVDREWLEEKTGYVLSKTEDLETEDGREKEEPEDGGRRKEEEIKNRYNPLQARDPAGTNTGGRWTSVGAASKGDSAKRGEMRKATEEERKKFGIAPAFTDPMITDDPDAELLATAKNAKGKTVYYYSQAYTESQKAAKFGRIAALHREMPNLQARIDQDIASGGPDREQALALRMVTLTGMRNGGDEGGGKVEAFGVSNLLTSHARVDGDKVHLDFLGKKGVRQLHSFEDGTLARHIAAKQQAGAAQIFDGDAGKTLGYLKKISGDKFKVHDFRTWHGTMLADATASKIAERGELPTTEKQFKAFQKRVSKVVARQLGNNPGMALKAYIHPQVFTPYQPAQ